MPDPNWTPLEEVVACAMYVGRGHDLYPSFSPNFGELSEAREVIGSIPAGMLERLQSSLDKHRQNV